MWVLSDVSAIFWQVVAWIETYPTASEILFLLALAILGWFSGFFRWAFSKVLRDNKATNVTLNPPEPSNPDKVYTDVNKHFVEIQQRQIDRLQDDLKDANSDKEVLYREIAELEKRIAHPEDYIEAALKASDQTQERLSRLSNEVDAEKLQRAKEAAKRLDFSAARKIFNDIISRNELAVKQTAAAEMGLGEIAEQEIRWQEAYDHYKRAYGLDAGNMSALASYARLTWRLGKAEEGIPLYESLRDWAREVHGKDSRDYASSLNNLASLYKAQNRLNEAEPLYDEALAIRRAALQEGHPDIAAGLNNLAGLYKDQNRLGEAEPLYEEALAIYRAALPVGHPDIATGLNNLASLYQDQNRLNEAEPLHEEAFEISRAALPEGHPTIERTRQSLEAVYERRPELRDV